MEESSVSRSVLTGGDGVAANPESGDDGADDVTDDDDNIAEDDDDDKV